MVLAIVAIAVAGSGIAVLAGDDSNDGDKAGQSRADRGKGKGAVAKRAERRREPNEAEGPTLPKSTCPPELSSNCVVASGRVIYVEAVDPDGDGDAHFVTISGENVTGGGMTVFDVRHDLRPDPLPEVGDIVGGAGPVYTGSYGQRQIEVVEFHVAR